MCTFEKNPQGAAGIDPVPTKDIVAPGVIDCQNNKKSFSDK